MQEFRVLRQSASSKNRERTVRILLWGSLAALAVATFLGIYSAQSLSTWVATTFAYLAIAIVGCAVCGAHYAAVQFGVEEANRKVALILADNVLIRRREGWPDVKIGLSEIRTVYERKAGLVIESTGPRRRIVVPHDVEGFATLRAELAKHSSIVEAPRASPPAFIPMFISVLSWVFVLKSTDADVVKVAGVSGLAILGWATFRIRRLSVPTPKAKRALWAMLAFSWLAALWIIFSHITRFVTHQ